MRLLRLQLSNFLSYRDAEIVFGDFTALVGPNASGKSNAMSALKLLRDIPEYGLQTAVLRRGGFDQLRHRSEGRPYDPSITLDFEVASGLPPSRYELHLGSVKGGRYTVKREFAKVVSHESRAAFTQVRGKVEITTDPGSDSDIAPAAKVAGDATPTVPDGQSAIPLAVSYGSFFPLWRLFQGLQVVEINPARVRELQDPTPGFDFEPDGSNTASVFEGLSADVRRALIDELTAIVPDLANIEVRRFSNKMTLTFHQRAGGSTRLFLANQMSDGTLRAFAILLALHQDAPVILLGVEEPEVAIHLGALRTLVDVLRVHAEDVQILATTHSADIIDALDIDQLRVVWSEDGASHVSGVADHTRDTVRTGLIRPGELLRADSLDPAIP